MRHVPLRNGDEQDAFSRYHLILHWRSGERKRIKRNYNRRVRRLAKLHLTDCATIKAQDG